MERKSTRFVIFNETTQKVITKKSSYGWKPNQDKIYFSPATFYTIEDARDFVKPLNINHIILEQCQWEGGFEWFTQEIRL